MIPTIYILYFLPKKQCARISIEKTIRKKPQNKLARRVVRRKEERKEKRTFQPLWLEGFFLFAAQNRAKIGSAQNIPKQNLDMFIPNKKITPTIYILQLVLKICICLYRNKNNTNYIYIIVSVKNLHMSIPKQKQHQLYIYYSQC